jgi:hypothetical protein
MKKEVAIKAASNELAITEGFTFGSENIISTDIRIPKILLVNQMSKIVSKPEFNARPGELRESFEGSKFGDVKNPIQVIPFYMKNTWTVKKMKNGKMEYYASQDRAGTDTDRPYEDKDADGVPMTNHKVMNLFVLVRGQDLSIPYMVSFMNKSFRLAAQPYLNKTKLLEPSGKQPPHIVWNLGSFFVEDDPKGKYYAFTLGAAKDESGKDIPTTTEELRAAVDQYKSITGHLKKGGKIDMSDVEDTETVTSDKTTSTEDVPF